MKHNKDSLGDRIKRYESVSRTHLMRRTPVIVRVDGKAFHTFTRKMHKPFDNVLIDAMVKAGAATAKTISGFKLGYHQSDEFTFYLNDNDTYETEAYFDNNVQKLTSVVASTFTAHFNKEMGGTTAVFDARAFNVPVEEVPNVFVWRQRDWQRNSLQMLSRSHFSHKELNGKKTEDMHEMLHSVGVNWADLDPIYKNGTFVLPDGSLVNNKLTYDDLSTYLAPQL